MVTTTPTESKIAISSGATEATAARTRRIYSPQEKADYLALFEQNGVTQADFCKEMSISEATFSFWRRAAREETASSESGAQFAEVQLSAPKAAETAAVTVHLPNGVKLEVPAACEAAWRGLGLLLKTLQS